MLTSILLRINLVMRKFNLTFLAFGFFLWSPNLVGAQGLVQAGGEIVINQGAHLVIDGSDGNYYDTLSGNIKVVNTGYIYVPGNWTNSSTSGVFTTNSGEVILDGDVQRIKGTDRTYFPTLDLRGNGNKWLDINCLVGGGFNQGNGALRCNNQLLILNSKILEINNPATSAITKTSGGIVSETDGATGYGSVQWNLGGNIGYYSIPFTTMANQVVPYIFNVQTPGVNSTNAGSLDVATYPTDATLSPSNRVLPLSVTNTNNEHSRESSERMVDRYWIVNANNFSTSPKGVTTFSYLDAEFDASSGSTNKIEEANLRPIRYNQASGTWVYPGSGSINRPKNQSSNTLSRFDGIYVLVDTTICPVAKFTWVGNCVDDLIAFTDRSTLSYGVIESWDWDFADGSITTEVDPTHRFSPFGNYDVQLSVLSSSGCVNTIVKTVVIDARAVADFTFDIKPIVGFDVQFNANTQNSTSWLWDFGDLGTSNGSDPTHIYEVKEVYEVELIANNDENCPDTLVKFIDVNDPSLLLFPTAFSPGNADALNNLFGLETEQEVYEYDLRIYTRWGEQIFQSLSRDVKWDGTYLGKEAMQGTYIFTAYFRDRAHEIHYQSGAFTLLRN
jgi:gliding motility-associated-like protein